MQQHAVRGGTTVTARAGHLTRPVQPPRAVCAVQVVAKVRVRGLAHWPCPTCALGASSDW